MNYKRALLCLSAFLTTAALFSGKITVYNDTQNTMKVTFSTYQNVEGPGGKGVYKSYIAPVELTILPGKSESYERKPNSNQEIFGITTKGYYGLGQFNFAPTSGNQNFAVKGAVGETFSDYSKIDVPELGTWQLWLKPS